MPSEIFKLIDSRYIGAALASDTTHDGITSFEFSMDLPTSEGSKSDRAMQAVKAMYARSDTDRLIIELLNYLYVENPNADTSTNNQIFNQLQKKVLAPRGVTLEDNGFVLSHGRNVDPTNSIPPNSPVAKVVEPPPFKLTYGAPLARVARTTDRVFVVHGRDMRPVGVLRRYLLFLGLRIMPWSEAVALTGEPQPHTYNIVKAGIDQAAAVIVIFSPDDLARVRDAHSQPDDPDRTPQGQARQNVILEAGMAFASAPHRTIFVKSERTRDISDIAGFNWVKLDGTWDSRADLKSRLEKAGAAVNLSADNLMDELAGPFKVE